ncbi:uncharacterized protein BP5553_06993 [Venustampulla echinocandica]|uniref:FZ domain-containing protein n=1 Tax=Venustampulla echinocandica TaxID=2656787 RepID=A0A370TI81_9HELO|nr:uncharacterized protein BP5553_06993 [Venustampulla echinocandica]RDL35062.1 hypothetical protein BP5553_06993 [Venustampulla echinocandica]
MPLPKLSPLQSRLAASLIASVMLLLLYFTFSFPHFAYAADVDSIQPEDHNHERLLGGPVLDVDLESLELGDISYQSEFVGVDRGIIGRTPTADDPTGLTNNDPVTINIELGRTVSYVFTNVSLYGEKSKTEPFLPVPRYPRRSLVDGEEEPEDVDEDEEGFASNKLALRQSSTGGNRTLYVSVTACGQPKPVQNTTTSPPPQLQLYISQTSDNKNPGPGKSPQVMVELVEGYGMYEMNATGDVFIGVYGKNDTAYTGPWSAQIAASIDAPFHYYHNISDPNLLLVDSDSSSAFLVADNPMKFDSYRNFDKWSKISPPYVLFASNAQDQAIQGLRHSYCGLANSPGTIAPDRPGQTNNQVQFWWDKEMTNPLPRQKFYVSQLSGATKYNAILAVRGNSTSAEPGVVGGGGQVFRQTDFSTLSESNCALVSNLTLCNQISYSVPANPTLFPNTSALAAFYENYTTTYWKFFQNAMSMVPCETTPSAQYSLATDCTRCEAAYKEWFCAVSVPRCKGFSATSSWLQPRAMGQPFPDGTFLDAEQLAVAGQSKSLNNSRNPTIDAMIKPGPYKEVLPCDRLCYNVVQNCPASLGFNCPLPGDIGFATSYFDTSQQVVVLDPNSTQTQMRCNYPGSIVGLGAGGRALPPQGLAVLLLVVLGLMFV